MLEKYLEINKSKVVGGVGLKTSNGGTQYYLQNRIYQGDICVTIATCCNPYYVTKGNFELMEKEDFMKNELMIRRLTPRECFRLQGFSMRNLDGTYNDEYFERASKVNNDRELYRQSGNSITVDVLCHIFENLLL